MAMEVVPRLLRLVAAVVLEADQQLTEKRAQRLAEDLEEIVEDIGSSSSKAIRDDLKSTARDLRRLHTSSSLSITLETVVRLTRACRQLGDCPSVPRRSPALPLELLCHIINLAQSTGFRERQQTNLALSYTSRDINRLVRPILRREIHITRGWHLRGLDKLIREEPTRSDEVEVVSFAVPWSELEHQQNHWFGRLMWDVLHALLNRRHDSPRLVFHLTLLPSADPRASPDDELCRVMGDQHATLLDLCGSFNMRDIRIHSHFKEAGSPYMPYAYAIGGPSHVSRLRITTEEPNREGVADAEGLSVNDFEVFACPDFAFRPTEMLLTLPNKEKCLEHVEIILVIPNQANVSYDDELEAIPKLFAAWAPSVRHLVLRIRNRDQVNAATTIKTVVQEVMTLEHLTSLAIGGTGFNFEHLGPLLPDCPTQDITILPIAPLLSRSISRLNPPADPQPLLRAQLEQLGSFPRLRRLEIKLPAQHPRSTALEEACAARDIDLRVEIVSGTEWTKHHES